LKSRVFSFKLNPEFENDFYGLLSCQLRPILCNGSLISLCQERNLPAFECWRTILQVMKCALEDLIYVSNRH